MLTGREAWLETIAGLRARRTNLLIVIPLVLATSAGVFLQRDLPLLFLPVLTVVFAAFRTGREGVAISIVVLAVIGGAATILGHGPMHLFSARVGAQLQFLQFYLAATILTALPVVADMQKRRALVAALRGSEERFRLLAEHSTDVLMHLTFDGRICYVSRSIEQYGGYPADALAGRKSTELIAPEDVERVRAEHRRVLQSRGAVVKFRCLGLMADGEKRWFEIHSRALLDEHGIPEGVLSIARDVNEQVLREQGLLDAAMTDTLTGLPNRRAFTRAVQARSREAGGKPRDCIALFDIDHFKRVNDSYGHPVGDSVLQAFASAASEAVRRDDVVARFGGEEFVILLPDTSREQALQVCERLRTEIAGLRLFAAGEVFRVTVSGGVAELGHAGLSEALQAADKALYEAKNGGRDRLALAA